MTTPYTTSQSRSTSSNRGVPPLVILGLDAGDPDWLCEWAEQGYLPTIASLMKKGAWARTAGKEMITEHGIWVSLCSGISRATHGYYYFRQPQPGTYDLRTLTGHDLDVAPFWACLQGDGFRVAVIDVPDAPFVDGLGGAQLANWAVHNPLDGPRSMPAEVLRELRSAIGPHTPIDEQCRSTPERDQQLYRLLLERVQRKGVLCRQLIGREHFNLAVAVFGESHTSGHQFWRYRPESSTSDPTDRNGLRHAIRNIYQAIDREMGLLLAQLPTESNVFVVSSVGLRDQYPTGGLIEAFCRRLGYQPYAAASPDAHPTLDLLRPLDLTRRLVPERWRLALSRRLPRDARERIVADQFRRSTDWSRTTAFSIPSIYSSYLRVNLRGREPSGIVEPGGEYGTILDRLEHDLEQLVDPETGCPAVKQVARTVEWFGGDPPVSLPDMFVEWQPCARFVRRVTHPSGELVQDEPEFFRDSDHSMYGFVVAAGPGIQGRGTLGDIAILDLAPTFLSLLGLPPAPSMAGAPSHAFIGSIPVIEDRERA